MELDRIRAWQLFIETSRLGSLALAEEALSFPLPKASRLISSLEDELGFQLLDRTKKPAVLTAEGQALVLDTQGLISQWGILREKADALRKGNFDLSRRSLRISLPVNMDRSVFFEALQNIPVCSLNFAPTSDSRRFWKEKPILLGLAINSRNAALLPFRCVTTFLFLLHRQSISKVMPKSKKWGI